MARPDRSETKQGQDGFSLIEVVVAIAVFSLGALAAMNVLGEDARSAEANERRAIASIVAENRLAEAMALTRAPAAAMSSGTEAALGRNWNWQVRVSASPDPRMVRIDVSVQQEGRSQILAELSSFRASP